MKIKLTALLLGTLVFLQIVCGFCESERAYIAIYGDSRTGHNVHREIVKAMMKYTPKIVFHTGDLVANHPGDWPIFNKIVSKLRKNSEFYPAVGNHEYYAGVELFFENFELPNNEEWYSVNKQGIHFIVLNSNVPILEISEQYKWLESDLQNISGNIKFTVVIFHHPIFSSQSVTNYMLKDVLTPLFEKYGVDIVFSGHTHAYERCLYNGIYYITTGGGGASLHEDEAKTKGPYTQKYIPAYHFCMLHIEDNKLFIDVLDKDSNLIDQFNVPSVPE